jgi:aromatic ring-cleaving dioxygenase
MRSEERFPWLMRNRGGLSILVHLLASDPVAEHREWRLRLGEPLAFQLDRLRPEGTPPRRPL